MTPDNFDIPIEPKPPTQDFSDRRKEPRHGFLQSCRVSIVAPAWAVTPEPLEGKTEDITLNGLRVNFDSAPSSFAANWEEANEGMHELKVTIEFIGLNDFPALKGQIVWFHQTDDSSECSIGVLFSIMKQGDQSKLSELVESFA